MILDFGKIGIASRYFHNFHCPISIVQKPFNFGGFRSGGTPVLIPNTAVKPTRADGSVRFTDARVGRRQN